MIETARDGVASCEQCRQKDVRQKDVKFGIAAALFFCRTTFCRLYDADLAAGLRVLVPGLPPWNALPTRLPPRLLSRGGRSLRSVRSEAGASEKTVPG